MLGWAQVQIFFGRYRMTMAAWIRLLVLSVVVNVLVVVAPIAFLVSAIPGGGILAFLVGVPLGVGVATGPALLTVVVAATFAHVRGYFSFLQFAVIGTLVACAIAARGIANGNDLLLDHLHAIMPLLPFAWVTGWLAAYYLEILPSPLPARVLPLRYGIAVLKGVVSAVMIAVPAWALSDFATTATDLREQRRVAERRGNCPEGLQCVVYSANTSRLDPALYVANLAGQQFVLGGNSLEYSLHNPQSSPGDVGSLSLHGLLPTFAPRSAANSEAFDFPTEDVASVDVRPICSPSGVCSPLPFAYSQSRLRPVGDPVYVVTDQHFPAPIGFTYLGDINNLNARSTTPQNADRHAYANAAKDEFILCDRLLDVPNPSCIHTFSWDRFRVDVRYQPQWLATWSKTKAHLIDQLEIATSFETIPANAVHIVDPLP